MINRLGTMALRLLPAEAAHGATIKSLELGLAGKARLEPETSLATTVFGLNFPSPLGLAAGFDKDARVPDAMLGLGFGFVECGSVTPEPQTGNPKPRLFRLPQDRAVINRMGFNNEGLDAFRARLEARAGKPGIVGVNLGANKESEDRIEDYVTGIAALSDLASYFVINVSSPNTPGLRNLQGKTELNDLLTRVMECRASQAIQPPLLVKIAPDLTEQDLDDIADAALAHQLDGLIISNTTIAHRDGLQSPHAHQQGGLSGAPLFEPSTAILSTMHGLLGGKVPLIGVGGISSGDEAYEKIRQGASLVQLYTALAFEGPDLIATILSEMAVRLSNDGFATVSEAIGSSSD